MNNKKHLSYIALDNFERKIMDNKTIYVLKNTSPNWLLNLHNEIKNRILSDKYTNSILIEVLEAIKDGKTTIEVDAFFDSKHIINWIKTGLNITQEIDTSFNGIDTFIVAQLYEKNKILKFVSNYLENKEN